MEDGRNSSSEARLIDCLLHDKKIELSLVPPQLVPQYLNLF